MLWAYIGPETMMPLASGVAAVVGVVLMFWHSIVMYLRKIGRLFGLARGPRSKRPTAVAPTPPPTSEAHPAKDA